MVAVILTWALFSVLLVAAAIFSVWRARVGEGVAAGFVGGVGAWLLSLGWGNHTHYVAWQIAVAAIAIVALTAAVAWRVPPHRRRRAGRGDWSDAGVWLRLVRAGGAQRLDRHVAGWPHAAQHRSGGGLRRGSRPCVLGPPPHGARKFCVAGRLEVGLSP